MSILDKISGRAKKTVGEATDNQSLRQQGRREERKGEAKDELQRDQEKVGREANEVADLERKT
jgi:uncharacterized protein YjbJ (UPF0337 family)